MKAHNITAAFVACELESVAYSVACKRKTDDRYRGTDNNCGHKLVNPLNACYLNNDSNYYINKTCENGTEDDTCKACFGRYCACKGCEH